MRPSDPNRPARGTRQRDKPAAGGSARERPGPAASRALSERAKDDVSSAPESGEKPEALAGGMGGASGPLHRSPGGRTAPARAKDDVSSAPESGDKPDAADD